MIAELYNSDIGKNVSYLSGCKVHLYFYFFVICMQSSARVKYFLFGQHLADGIRITLAIIIPALIGASIGKMDQGVAVSLGALAVSISDAPGPVKHKRNGMFYCVLLVGLMTLITGLLNHSPFNLGVLVVVSAFFFSMFSVYGNRVASIGSAVLLVMALRMADVQPVNLVLRDTLLVTAGGAWYMAMSMAFYILVPFRPIQRALGECIAETAQFLQFKSDMYDPDSDIDKTYNSLIHQQTIVSDRQNEVRELLFKNRAILKESTYEGRKLVVVFASTVDLFEQVMATWYDYGELRKRYASSDVLRKISEVIRLCAAELKQIGEAIHSQSDYVPQLHIIPLLDRIKQDTEAETGAPLDFTLRKILIHIRDLNENISDIGIYFSNSGKHLKPNFREKDYQRFVAHQKTSFALFRNNLTFKSSAFRHSLRVMITCAAGYALGMLFLTGEHSYWIIMTIIIIMKPAYSLTKSKNTDRLLGTIAGAVIGLIILFLIKDDTILFALLVFFMLGTYTFVRLSYITMVVFLTPYVLILFHFLHLNIINIAGERLLDTAIASVLAWAATRFLFPRWESQTIRKNLIAVLKANQQYLFILRQIAGGGTITSLEYKLGRKDVFVNTANLSAALHRMQSEPESKQKFRLELYELVVLNHVLSSNIASAVNEVQASEKTISSTARHHLFRADQNLSGSIQIFEPQFVPPELPDRKHIAASAAEKESTPGEYEFIRRLTHDIKGLSHRIANL